MNKDFYLKFYSRLFESMRADAELQVLLDHYDHYDIPDFEQKVEREFDAMIHSMEDIHNE